MSAPSLKIDVNKMSAAPSQDEESGMQHYTVRVKFTFGDSGKVVERSFSSGETGLGMKKQLFDSLSVDYGKMTLAVDGTELIGALKSAPPARRECTSRRAARRRSAFDLRHTGAQGQKGTRCASYGAGL
eukprot:TRINITY_DN1236_c0_g1_i4.p1 TRINITY_DN1236_c0_g1~~TRINITY_DN1236_c0_g1_i4.p1  ORF type:complete len:129 (-),score=33.51 TRINITY_DN1236_c0_g1_i4:151-537(-)